MKSVQRLAHLRQVCWQVIAKRAVRAVVTGIFVWALLAKVAAEMAYFTDLNAANEVAKKDGKIVILYTGRTHFCKNPKAFFFKTVLGEHPDLAKRADKFVACEQFLFATMYDKAGRVSQRFRDEMESDTARLYDRYDIRLFHPTVTFLDSEGNKLNGPFTFEAGAKFSSLDRDCYETLADYAKADQPLSLAKAQVALAAASLRPEGEQTTFELIRFRYHPNGGQKVLLIDNGLPSDRFELLDSVSFVVRECAVQSGYDMGGKWPAASVTATGNFDKTEPFQGPVMVRLNGAYFRSDMDGVGDFKGAAGVRFKPGEHFLYVHLRQKAIAEAILCGFQGLKLKAAPETQSIKPAPR